MGLTNTKFLCHPNNESPVFQHLKNLGIIQWLFRIIHYIYSKSSALVRIRKRRGGIYYCKSKTFIWIVQGFWKKSDNLTGYLTIVRNLMDTEKTPTIPIKALREDLTNTICHKLLDAPSGNVVISVEPYHCRCLVYDSFLGELGNWCESYG